MKHHAASTLLDMICRPSCLSQCSFNVWMRGCRIVPNFFAITDARVRHILWSPCITSLSWSPAGPRTPLSCITKDHTFLSLPDGKRVPCVQDMSFIMSVILWCFNAIVSGHCLFVIPRRPCTACGLSGEWAMVIRYTAWRKWQFVFVRQNNDLVHSSAWPIRFVVQPYFLSTDYVKATRWWWWWGW
jgi:hypothetical protein